MGNPGPPIPATRRRPLGGRNPWLVPALPGTGRLPPFDVVVTDHDVDSLAAAGLDVFDPEPPAPDSPLRDHPRVITTSHVAWYLEAANAERRRTAAGYVRDALTGAKPDHVVEPDARGG